MHTDPILSFSMNNTKKSIFHLHQYAYSQTSSETVVNGPAVYEYQYWYGHMVVTLYTQPIHLLPPYMGVLYPRMMSWVNGSVNTPPPRGQGTTMPSNGEIPKNPHTPPPHSLLGGHPFVYSGRSIHSIAECGPSLTWLPTRIKMGGGNRWGDGGGGETDIYSTVIQ